MVAYKFKLAKSNGGLDDHANWNLYFDGEAIFCYDLLKALVLQELLHLLHAGVSAEAESVENVHKLAKLQRKFFTQPKFGFNLFFLYVFIRGFLLLLNIVKSRLFLKIFVEFLVLNLKFRLTNELIEVIRILTREICFVLLLKNHFGLNCYSKALTVVRINFFFDCAASKECQVMKPFPFLVGDVQLVLNWIRIYNICEYR